MNRPSGERADRELVVNTRRTVLGLFPSLDEGDVSPFGGSDWSRWVNALVGTLELESELSMMSPHHEN